MAITAPQTIEFAFWYRSEHLGRGQEYNLFPDEIGNGRIHIADDIVESDALPKALRKSYTYVKLSADGVNGAKNETAVKKIRRLLAEADARGWNVVVNERCVNGYKDRETFERALDIYEGKVAA